MTNDLGITQASDYPEPTEDIRQTAASEEPAGGLGWCKSMYGFYVFQKERVACEVTFQWMGMCEGVVDVYVRMCEAFFAT